MDIAVEQAGQVTSMQDMDAEEDVASIDAEPEGKVTFRQALEAVEDVAHLEIFTPRQDQDHDGHAEMDVADVEQALVRHVNVQVGKCTSRQDQQDGGDAEVDDAPGQVVNDHARVASDPASNSHQTSIDTLQELRTLPVLEPEDIR